MGNIFASSQFRGEMPGKTLNPPRSANAAPATPSLRGLIASMAGTADLIGSCPKLLVFTIAAITGAVLAWGLAAGRDELSPSGSAQQTEQQFVSHFHSPLAPPRDPHYEQMKVQYQMSSGRADVVMLGDSITEFSHWRDLFPDLNIANRGIAGDTIDRAVKRLDPVISLHPRQVFVMLGVNDLLLGQSPYAALSNYSEIVRRLSAAGIDVFAQSVLFTSYEETNKKIAVFNQMLSHHCQQTGLCRYVDLSTKIAASNTFDGIHPTAVAYQIWRDAIADKISPVRRHSGDFTNVRFSSSARSMNIADYAQ